MVVTRKMSKRLVTPNKNCVILKVFIFVSILTINARYQVFSLSDNNVSASESITEAADFDTGSHAASSHSTAGAPAPLSLATVQLSAATPTSTTTATATTDFVMSPGVLDQTPITGWQCHCWNSSNEIQNEFECKCEGISVLRIPQLLPQNMQRLTIVKAGIVTIRATGLNKYGAALKDLILTDLKEFSSIEDGAFENIQHLRTISISHAPKLKYLSAEVFRGISDSLKSLRIYNSGLVKFPDLKLISPNTILHMVDLDSNQITRIDEKSIKLKTEKLLLDNNLIQYVDKSAFYGSEIGKLSLKGNLKLRKLHKNAFNGIVNIRDLDLSSTSIDSMPAEGLNVLETLNIQNTHSLKIIPSVYNFKNLKKAVLTHPFHCCAFKFPSRHDPIKHAERVKYFQAKQQTCIAKGYHVDGIKPSNGNGVPSANDEEQVRIKRQISLLRLKRFLMMHENKSMEVSNILHSMDIFNSQIHGSPRTDMEIINEHYLNAITGSPVTLENLEVDGSEIFTTNTEFGNFHPPVEVKENNLQDAFCGNITDDVINVECEPVPDALNPCEDVMGSHWLRGSVWVVVLLAVFGNMAVLIVLFSNKSDITVPKFLMSHLAFADLSMGLYLLLIASIDVHSMGEYFNFAYDWQYGAGCKAAGFLTVFASHLSIFTLTIITLERWFAITHAIYLNKRIKLKTAIYIMFGGWIYSAVMAALPLFGISNYSSTSICLPMETRDMLDKIYLITIMGVNGLAFVIIVICYAQIYYSLGKETRQATRHTSSREMTVAKKMALLVFTNFVCWAPIAFFGLTAIAGYALIDVTKSKILLVFFYPLNSCANPYLYAILTAQYRRDLFLLLSKYGYCTQRAQQYKMTYSLPTATIPVPLIGRNSITGAHRKSSLDRGQNIGTTTLMASQNEALV